MEEKYSSDLCFQLNKCILVVNATVDSHYFCTATVLLWLVLLFIFFYFLVIKGTREIAILFCYTYQNNEYTHLENINVYFLFASSNYLLRALKSNQCVKLRII